MAKKKRNASKKSSTEKLTRAEREAEELKKYRRTRLILIIMASVALVAILAAAVVGIILAVRANESVDYMNDDLSQFVYISEDDYKKFPVKLKIDPIDEMAIDSALAEALYNMRGDAEYDGVSYHVPIKSGVRDVIQAGDDAYIYYIGYELGEDGEKLYFGGGCNFSKELPDMLGIGSGSFITGFESGLIGKKPNEYSTLSVVKDRGIEYGDYVVLTYTVISDGSGSSTDGKDVSVTLKLEEGVTDKRYGVGFEEFLLGKTVGEIEGSATTTLGTEKLKYTDVTVTKVLRGGDKPITLEARFPRDYPNDQTMAGKTVFFDVYVKKMTFYETPAIDESFVTEKLKMTLDEIKKYGDEGASILECYRGYLEDNIKATVLDSAASSIRGAMWDHFNAKVVIKRLPEGEVRDYYNDYIDDIYSEYDNNKSYYSTFEEFVATYMEIDDPNAVGWENKVREQAELAVTEKLVFYYVIRREGFIPTGEVYEENFKRVKEELLAEILEAYKCTEDQYKTREEYEAAVAEYREWMEESYGDAYFRDNVIYEYAIEKLMGFADIEYEG
ncbi:MAG: hypothetical protein IKC87_01205 [Clostridia bacterium]|nr:hypothetical protein [Clostridia bacterium]